MRTSFIIVAFMRVAAERRRAPSVSGTKSGSAARRAGWPNMQLGLLPIGLVDQLDAPALGRHRLAQLERVRGGGGPAAQAAERALRAPRPSASGSTSPANAKTRFLPTKWRRKCAAISSGRAPPRSPPGGRRAGGRRDGRRRGCARRNAPHSARSSLRSSSIWPAARGACVPARRRRRSGARGCRPAGARKASRLRASTSPSKRVESGSSSTSSVAPSASSAASICLARLAARAAPRPLGGEVGQPLAVPRIGGGAGARRDHDVHQRDRPWCSRRSAASPRARAAARPRAVSGRAGRHGRGDVTASVADQQRADHVRASRFGRATTTERAPVAR